MTMLDNLLKMYEQGQDNVLLRFSLGNEFFKADDLTNAEMHLRAALQHDPKYSAPGRFWAGCWPQEASMLWRPMPTNRVSR